jgi:hypothetical protein
MATTQHSASDAGMLERQALIRREVERAAARHGWTDVVRDHALREALGRTAEDEARAAQECVSETTAGLEVRCPAWPQPCTYVRVCQAGFEIGYWLSDQWRDQPEEVAGAIFGTLAQADDQQQQDLQRSPESALDNSLDLERGTPQPVSAASNAPDLDGILSRGSVTTYALGNNPQGLKELLKLEVRLADLSTQHATALLNAEHQDIAMSRARALGLRNVVVFDETSPAARQMRELMAAAGPATVKVLIEVSGGLVQDVTTDMPARVLVLDADIEGSSDEPVLVRGQKVCVSLFESDERDAASSKADIDLVFNEALVSAESDANAAQEQPTYEQARA